MTAIEDVWLAGFFSGEGCISVGKNGSGRLYVVVSLANTDEEAVGRFHERFGGRVYTQHPGSVHNPLQRRVLYTWKLAKQAEVAAALEVLRPYLSNDKRAQAERCLTTVAAQAPIDRQRAWRARRARYGPSGGNRKSTRAQPA